ncbi:hypothetical protein D3C81_801880 [compost metagenome]
MPSTRYTARVAPSTSHNWRDRSCSRPPASPDSLACTERGSISVAIAASMACVACSRPTPGASANSIQIEANCSLWYTRSGAMP